MLALFPLQIVVFPGEKLPLHIFEERYQQLIRDCEEGGLSFGVPAYLHGNLEYGCEVLLQRVVKRYPDGKMDVVCKGARVFRLKSFDNPMPGKLYPGGKVNFLKDVSDGTQELREEAVDLLSELYEHIGVGYEPMDPFFFETYALGHKMGLSVEQEYELLQITSEAERLEYVIDHMERVLPIVKQVNATKHQIQMNGHFRNYDPLDFKDFTL